MTKEEILKQFDNTFVWDDDEECLMVRNEYSRGPFVGVRKADQSDIRNWLSPSLDSYAQTIKAEAVKEDRPKDWRKGQTIFNFLEWLRNKGFGTIQSSRMADPFYIGDEEWDKLYSEYLSSLSEGGDR
jgi:hypothetical protein